MGNSSHILSIVNQNHYSLPINPKLVPYIKSIEVNFLSNSNNKILQPYKVLPNLYAVMGIQTSGQLHLLDNDKSRLLSRGGISGIQTCYRTFQPTELSIKTTLIRFQPWATPLFFNTSAQQFSDAAIGMTDIFYNQLITDIEEQLSLTEDPLNISQIIQGFLINRLLSNKHKLPHASLTVLTKKLLSNPHTQSIDNLAKAYDFSKRNLERLFQTYIGVTPKKFALIARFQKVIHNLHTGSHWQNFAEELGYYDQAHFINEFKKFAGLTPTQFMANLKASQQ